MQQLHLFCLEGKVSMPLLRCLLKPYPSSIISGCYKLSITAAACQKTRIEEKFKFRNATVEDIPNIKDLIEVE